VPSTTVHFPDDILDAIDARARAEGLSRNRFITRALRRALDATETWPPGFLATLRESPAAGDAEAVERMLAAILARRSSKTGVPHLRAKPPPSGSLTRRRCRR